MHMLCLNNTHAHIHSPVTAECWRTLCC